MFVYYLTSILIKRTFPWNKSWNLTYWDLSDTSNGFRIQFSYASYLYIYILGDLNIIRELTQEWSRWGTSISIIALIAKTYISGYLICLLGLTID